MFALERQEPRWEELIPARGDRPAVEVLFPAVPTEKAIRKARDEARRILIAGGPDAIGDAGAAFSRELVRWSILDWRGIGTDDETPVAPTQDTVVIDDATDQFIVTERGTISAFLAEPRLMDAADLKFVLPFTERDAEKNGFAPSPDGTSAGATQVAVIAPPRAKRSSKAAALSARTARRPRKPKTVKTSGR